MNNPIEQVFSSLRITEPKFQDVFRSSAEVVRLQKGDFIVEEGRYIKKLAFVTSGRVRVWQSFEEREIFLYSVKPVQTCVLSLSACFEDYLSKVSAVAEEESVVVTIPTRHVSPWQGHYASWDRFLIETYRASYDDLLDLLYSLAFKKLDQRLIAYLNSQTESNASDTLFLSHAQLAKELGSSREVISRLLKQMEYDGYLELGVKSIRLVNK